MEQLHARYDTQLAYYEEALGKITGMDIKEKLLYSFYLEKCGA
jgi:ATP-dependent exoDNAse (exonuclease V) beta subunit